MTRGQVLSGDVIENTFEGYGEVGEIIEVRC